MSKKKKQKKMITDNIAVIFMLIPGVIAGFLVGDLKVDILGENVPFIPSMLIFLVMFITMIYVPLLLHTVVHEAGHMVFGMISGYKFSSYRILSFMWIKENDKIKFKRCKIVGTDGQCLMLPPDTDGENCPVILYNLGGSIMNIIVSSIALVVLLAVRDIPQILYVFLFTFMLLGFGVALINGIPMPMSNVNNDGYNAFLLSRDNKARRAFCIQLKINSEMANGVRLKDMPDEWFEIPSDEDMKNGMIAANAVFAVSRFIDQKNFEDAEKLISHMLDTENGMVGLHRKALTSERIFIEIITENRRAVVEQMLTKEQKQFMKSMQTNISILRTEYAYALLCEKDDKKAAEIKRKFDKATKRSPYAGDIQCEKELIEIAEKMRS